MKAQLDRNEQLLNALFRALTNANARHLIEILALRDRDWFELRHHFDLTAKEFKEVADNLRELGLIDISTGAPSYSFRSDGLNSVKHWIADIDSIRAKPRIPDL